MKVRDMFLERGVFSVIWLMSRTCGSQSPKLTTSRSNIFSLIAIMPSLFGGWRNDVVLFRGIYWGGNLPLCFALPTALGDHGGYSFSNMYETLNFFQFLNNPICELSGFNLQQDGGGYKHYLPSMLTQGLTKLKVRPQYAILSNVFLYVILNILKCYSIQIFQNTTCFEHNILVKHMTKSKGDFFLIFPYISQITTLGKESNWSYCGRILNSMSCLGFYGSLEMGVIMRTTLHSQCGSMMHYYELDRCFSDCFVILDSINANFLSGFLYFGQSWFSCSAIPNIERLLRKNIELKSFFVGFLFTIVFKNTLNVL
ncbi:hypothetical protein ACJX0J_025797, partial [Zea mays]